MNPVDATNNKKHDANLHIVKVKDLTKIPECEGSSWFAYHGKKSEQVSEPEYMLLLAERGVSHELDVIKQEIGEVQLVPKPNWPDEVAETLKKMEAGEPTIIQAALEFRVNPDLKLCGRVDVLQRQEIPSKLGSWSYFPIEIKQHSSAKEGDWLQIASYCWLLEQIQGILPIGALWSKSSWSENRQNKERRDLSKDYVPKFYHILNNITKPDKPPIRFGKHCDRCNWRKICSEKALADNDIAILPKLDYRTAENLRESGRHTLSDIAVMNKYSLAQYPHVSLESAELLIRQAEAISKNQVILRKPTSQLNPLPKISLFLDIETDGSYLQEPWAFGFAENETKISMLIVDPRKPLLFRASFEDMNLIFVPSPAEGWKYLAQRVSQKTGKVAHWANYEIDNVSKFADSSTKKTLLPLLLDAHKELLERLILPIPRLPGKTSGGLKAIGNWLGTTWPEGANDSLIAGEYFREWLKKDDKEKLAKALNYLKTDVIVLIKIWNWLASQLPQ